jgi:2-dehydro-3-deoxygluconokinase
MVAARKHGTMISYDLNYRDSLWKSIGGKARATEVNRELASYVDVMIGNEEDFTAALGFQIEGVGEHLGELDSANFRKMIEKAVATFPNFRAVATTLRHAKTASVNDWGAVCYYEGEFHEARPMPDLEIFDRVGGGDSFASGLIYGFLNEKGADWAVNCGCAHGALAMTTPGDTTMATFDERAPWPPSRRPTAASWRRPTPAGIRTPTTAYSSSPTRALRGCSRARATSAASGCDRSSCTDRGVIAV